MDWLSKSTTLSRVGTFLFGCFFSNHPQITPSGLRPRPASLASRLPLASSPEVQHLRGYQVSLQSGTHQHHALPRNHNTNHCRLLVAVGSSWNGALGLLVGSHSRNHLPPPYISSLALPTLFGHQGMMPRPLNSPPTPPDTLITGLDHRPAAAWSAQDEREKSAGCLVGRPPRSVLRPRRTRLTSNVPAANRAGNTHTTTTRGRGLGRDVNEIAQ
jgi:hypothetical protein